MNLRRGSIIRACHDAKLRNMCPDQAGANLRDGVWHRMVHVKRPAFVGSPRKVVFFMPLSGLPVVWAGSVWFSPVKSWIVVKP